MMNDGDGSLFLVVLMMRLKIPMVMRVCFPFGSFCFVLFGSAFGFLWGCRK